MTSDNPMVTITITMTPEDYVRLKNDALWKSRDNIGRYLVDYALGRIRGGC